MAVVGSRKASDYGKAATKKIVSGLASKGIIIVSGMATGVDSYAHIYCMEMGTPTVAVLGTPIDQVYPKKNRKLRDEILEKGGLILSQTRQVLLVFLYFLPIFFSFSSIFCILGSTFLFNLPPAILSDRPGKSTSISSESHIGFAPSMINLLQP